MSKFRTYTADEIAAGHTADGSPIPAKHLVLIRRALESAGKAPMSDEKAADLQAQNDQLKARLDALEAGTKPPAKAKASKGSEAGTKPPAKAKASKGSEAAKGKPDAPAADPA